MEILQLCKKFPYPIKDGESIAINNLSKSLAELGASVTLLAMNTYKHYFDGAEVPSALHHYREVHRVDVDNRLKIGAAFTNLFSGRSYHIERFFSHAFDRTLARILSESSFDAVQLETLYLAPYIPTIRRHSDAKVVMRAHNVEQEIWRRIAQNERNWLRKQYLSLLTRRLEKYERQQLDSYDLLLAISKKDLEFFRRAGFSKTGAVVPIGIDSKDYEPDYSCYQKNLSLSFIGSLDWMPNIEGLAWFLERVWEPARSDLAGVRLHIAGRKTPVWLYKFGNEQTNIHGEIDDAKSFINSHAVMVVPLLSGSGMRAKILEGMALGKVVITTSVGLEGIEAKHDSELLVADSPEAFLSRLKWCSTHRDELEKIGRAARAFVLRHYDSKEIARMVLSTHLAPT